MNTLLKLFELYDRLPWLIRSLNPVIFLAYVLYYFHRLFHFNFMEFLGVTFSLLVTFYWVIILIQLAYRNWIGVALGHSADLSKFGKWAVITGSTQGIGLAYAHALAKRGLNVVLLSRSADKLAQVALEISDLYPVSVKTIAVDFTGGIEIYEDVQKQLANLEVGVLINNVGICYDNPEYFCDLPNGLKFSQDMINCNILSMTMMTYILVPGMLERRKGVVVNVGSFTSFLDSPFLALYAATKSFMDKFTSDLELEYREHGILFQSLIPGYVVSNMSKIKQSYFWVPTAETFVEAALNSVGLQKRSSVWLPHQILHFVVRVGHFFRRDGAAYITHMIGKQFWLYGKKVMIYRSKKSG